MKIKYRQNFATVENQTNVRLPRALRSLQGRSQNQAISEKFTTDRATEPSKKDLETTKHHSH